MCRRRRGPGRGRRGGGRMTMRMRAQSQGAQAWAWARAWAWAWAWAWARAWARARAWSGRGRGHRRGGLVRFAATRSGSIVSAMMSSVASASGGCTTRRRRRARRGRPRAAWWRRTRHLIGSGVLHDGAGVDVGRGAASGDELLDRRAHVGIVGARVEGRLPRERQRRALREGPPPPARARRSRDEACEGEGRAHPRADPPSPMAASDYRGSGGGVQEGEARLGRAIVLRKKRRGSCSLM